MGSLKYLWLNRAHFKFGSENFFRAWAKRIVSLPELMYRNFRRYKFVIRGANISPTAEIGHLRADGNKNKLTIGGLTFIGRVYMALHDEIEIGERVCINDGVEILTASHEVDTPRWEHVKKKIVIEDYAWISTGAVILPGVRLGRGCVVGARAVVSKSVGPGEIVVGNPARPITKKRPENLTYNPCDFSAADRAWLVG